jgi:hypothetical protein
MPILIRQEQSIYWRGADLARLNSRAATLMGQILLVPGVLATIVYDNNGERLGAYLNEEFVVEEWQKAGLVLAQMLAVVGAGGAGAREMELRSAGRCLYVRSLGNAFSATLCRIDVNWAMLRMTVNVAASSFESDGELQGTLMLAAPSLAETLNERLLSDDELRWVWRIVQAGA